MGVQVAEIDPSQGIVKIGDRIAFGNDHAQAGFLEYVRRDPSDEHVARAHGLELILTKGERADVPPPYPAAELTAKLQVHWSSRWTQAQPAGEKRPAVVCSRS